MTSILYISLVVIFCCNVLIVMKKQLVKAGLMTHLDRNIIFFVYILRHILDWPIRNGSLTAMDLLTTLAFLLVFIILWKHSFRFRYCIKFIYFNTVVVFMTGVCILPIAIWKPKSVDNLRWVSRADFRTVSTNRIGGRKTWWLLVQTNTWQCKNLNYSVAERMILSFHLNNFFRFMFNANSIIVLLWVQKIEVYFEFDG